MQDVPAQYLFWLWCQPDRAQKLRARDPVFCYIESRLSHLQQEHPDGIWD